jgi:hypothetical protein
MTDEIRALLSGIGPGDLSESELQRLMVAALCAARGAYVTEEDLNKIIKWAMNTRLGAMTLEMVLRGVIGIEWSEEAGTIMFRGFEDDEGRECRRLLDGIKIDGG